MPRKVLAALLLLGITLLIWIYQTSNAEFDNTVSLLKENQVYFYKPIISPPTSPLAIILVTSYVGHVELRSAHRRAMTSDYLKSITQSAINDESDAFHDILQGSFYENYRNLTYKHLMGLQWASSNCRTTSFIIKVDDDTVFNFDKTYSFLSHIPIKERDDLIIGYTLKNTSPRRNKQNKWYVTWDEYSRQMYPPYLSGWYYIISPKLAAMICSEAPYHPYFWIDDIFVTGILTDYIGIKLKQLPDNFWLEYYELLDCCLRDMLNKGIECEYVVGPNGGRNELLVEFNDSFKICKNNCTSRDINKKLKDTCVMPGDRTLFSNGQAQVHDTLL
ncbi:unnamed protein product [Leptidea sinapis]|uniref:Hexosyltransferase n=1 Tax=Leptidea sinapis TaxID=189913 RepID=A0A5E4QT98_9NEOP|nr:unnamed protein product [Leptidea sinapis]